MKKAHFYIYFLLVFGISQICLATEATKTLQYTKNISSGHEKVQLRIELRKYDPARKDDSKIPCPYFGDIPPTKPQYIIKSFNVRWNDNPINVPKKMYYDLYDPVLRERLGFWDDMYGVFASLGSGSESLLIEMNSISKGSRNYKVWIVIRKDGNHTRFMDNSLP